MQPPPAHIAQLVGNTTASMASKINAFKITSPFRMFLNSQEMGSEQVQNIIGRQGAESVFSQRNYLLTPSVHRPLALPVAVTPLQSHIKPYDIESPRGFDGVESGRSKRDERTTDNQNTNEDGSDQIPLQMQALEVHKKIKKSTGPFINSFAVQAPQIKRKKNKKVKTHLQEQYNNRKWSTPEHQAYLEFVFKNRDIMESPEEKKRLKIYKEMSNYIKTRDPDQCRSHDQKFCPFRNPHLRNYSMQDLMGEFIKNKEHATLAASNEDGSSSARPSLNKKAPQNEQLLVEKKLIKDYQKIAALPEAQKNLLEALAQQQKKQTINATELASADVPPRAATTQNESADNNQPTLQQEIEIQNEEKMVTKHDEHTLEQEQLSEAMEIQQEEAKDEIFIEQVPKNNNNNEEQEGEEGANLEEIAKQMTNMLAVMNRIYDTIYERVDMILGLAREVI